MQLELYEIVNWCQYRQRREQFQPGLTAIIGANGSGKSNFLGGIRYALTGKNPNPGTKEENISQYADAGENSYVQLTFSHAGVRAIVTRHLRPERKKPTLEVFSPGLNADSIRGEEAVNERICAILGLEAEAINEIVLVAQEDIFGFLSKTAAKRMAAFQKLFRLEAAPAAYEAIRQQLASVPQVATGPDLDEIRRRYQEANARLQSLQGESTILPEFMTISNGLRQDSQVADDANRKEHMLAQLATATASLESYRLQVKIIEAQISTTQQNVETLREAADASQAHSDRAKQLLANLSRYQTGMESKGRTEMRLQQKLEQLSRLPSPVPPSNYCRDLDKLSEELQTLHQKILRDEKMLNDLAQKGLAECPTCHTPLKGGISQELERARRELPGDKARRQQLIDADCATKEHDRKLQEYHGCRLRIAADIDGYRRELAVMEELVCPTVDQPGAQAMITQHEDFLHGLRSYETELARQREQLASNQGAAKAQAEQCDELSRNIAAIVVTREHVLAAEERIAQWQRQMDRRRQLDAELAAQQSTVNHLAEELARWEAAERQARILSGWRQRAERMQAIVHWSALPTWVIQRNLQRLSIATNETLDRFQAEFRVEADDNLSFRARFLDQRVQPAERLSWGQKVILALAVRLALNLTVAANVGFLALDEPTAYLDQHHIRGFTPVLQRLRTFAASSGLQCVMITHEAALGPLFDQVIQI